MGGDKARTEALAAPKPVIAPDPKQKKSPRGGYFGASEPTTLGSTSRRGAFLGG
jgi:hypothetical protein